MADGPQPQPATEFELETATLGKLACRRVTVSALMSVMKHTGGDAHPDARRTVQSLVSGIASKADDTRVSFSEAAALTEAEIEAFARNVLKINDDLRPAEGTTHDSATDALAVGLKARERELFGTLVRPGLGALGGFAALKDSIGASAARAVATPVFVRGKPVGVASPNIEQMVASLPPKARPADIAIRRIEERRAAFAAQLSADREAAMVVASGPGGACFYVADVEALDADYLSFRGLDDDGEPVEIVQHASQCNVMFLPVRKAVARGPLGFKPEER